MIQLQSSRLIYTNQFRMALSHFSITDLITQIAHINTEIFFNIDLSWHINREQNHNGCVIGFTWFWEEVDQFNQYRITFTKSGALQKNWKRQNTQWTRQERILTQSKMKKSILWNLNIKSHNLQNQTFLIAIWSTNDDVQHLVIELQRLQIKQNETKRRRTCNILQCDSHFLRGQLRNEISGTEIGWCTMQYLDSFFAKWFSRRLKRFLIISNSAWS